MRVVIDTNVLVSAIIRDRKPETVILFVVSNPDIGWIVTPGISDEYKYSFTIFWIPTFVGMTSFRRKPESIITKNI